MVIFEDNQLAICVAQESADEWMNNPHNEYKKSLGSEVNPGNRY